MDQKNLATLGGALEANLNARNKLHGHVVQNIFF
jgi:hypothetical protein